MSRLVELVGFETTEDAILHIRTTIPDRDFGVDSDTTVGSNKPAVAVLNASSASAGKSGISGVVAQEIFGDALNNVLTGTSTNDVISGRDGADNISGGAGDDTLYGHSTADLNPGVRKHPGDAACQYRRRRGFSDRSAWRQRLRLRAEQGHGPDLQDQYRHRCTNRIPRHPRRAIRGRRRAGSSRPGFPPRLRRQRQVLRLPDQRRRQSGGARVSRVR